MIVKSGDKYPIQWRVNMDLTAASARLLVKPLRPHAAEFVELDSSVVDASDGLLEHVLTGELPIGKYRVEVEVSLAGEVFTFPNDAYASLEVIPDLD